MKKDKTDNNKEVCPMAVLIDEQVRISKEKVTRKYQLEADLYEICGSR